jgi:tetratricopeptide (TPR) repeat protein
MSRLKIFNLIGEMREKLGMHEVIIKEIDEMLSKIRPYAMLDLFTISNYHTRLGKALITTGQKKEALSELIIALNIYNKFETPVQEGLDTLQQIIDIYKEGQEEKYIKYYSDQYEDLKEKIEELNQQKEEKMKALDVVREFWLFMNEGVEAFSHAPESKLDPLLFGGFISALQSFSFELTSEHLRTISIGVDKYTLYREEDMPFFIICRSHLKSPEDKIVNILKMLFQEFWKQYEEELKNFDGEVSQFEGFLDVVKELKS